MNLFQRGDFVLNSGARSGWKIECDALTDGDIEALALMVAKMVEPFSTVEGVPRGGLRLAAALQPYAVTEGPHLIVDDVLTTGGSLQRLRAKSGSEGRVIGAVLFARGPLPPWVLAVFQLPACFWIYGVSLHTA